MYCMKTKGKKPFDKEVYFKQAPSSTAMFNILEDWNILDQVTAKNLKELKDFSGTTEVVTDDSKFTLTAFKIHFRDWATGIIETNKR